MSREYQGVVIFGEPDIFGNYEEMASRREFIDLLDAKAWANERIHWNTLGKRTIATAVYQLGPPRALVYRRGQ